LLLRKISKFDATRCHIVRLKCTKFVLVSGGRGTGRGKGTGRKEKRKRRWEEREGNGERREKKGQLPPNI